jgi:hypothetical protein
MPLPSTGSVSTRRIEADRMVQLNRQDKMDTMPVDLDTSREAMNVIEPPSDDRPRTCKAMMATDIAELLL